MPQLIEIANPAKYLYCYHFCLKLSLSCAPMNSPSKQAGSAQNLYEIPSCTICLQDLSEDLASLGCGHVYHLGCISQHFEYKGTCPNCQKRASLKQVRTIHFQIILSNKNNSKMLSLLSGFDVSEKKQINNLMMEICKLTESNQKITNENNSNKISMDKQNELVDTLRKQMHRLKSQNDKLRKEYSHTAKALENTQAELTQHLKIEMKLRLDVDRLKGQERQFQHMKKLSKIITQRSQEQLITRGTPPEEMAKTFYDMLLMKNLQMLRLKQKLRDFPEKINEREMQVARLKTSLESIRKELKELNDKKNVERKRYEDLKAKFKALTEKAKQKGVKDNDIPQMDDSQGFNTLKKSFHIPQIPIAQLTLKKPLFTQSTIGGFISKRKETQRMMAQ